VVLLLILQAPLTFRIDDWAFLLNRSAGTALEPHYGHLMVVQLLIYRGLLNVFGMDSAQPFQAVSTLLFAVALALLFVWLRDRVGAWLALAGLLPVLVMGSASEDLLWSFQLAVSGSMACGVGAFLALDRRRYRWACVLLVGSLAFSSLGICFVLAALARLLIERRHAYVVAIPIALYAAWWAGWDRGASSQVTGDNLVHAPAYVVGGFASSLASLFGQVNHTALLAFPQTYAIRAGPEPIWYVLLAGAVIGALVLLRGRFSFRLIPVLVLAGSYWFLVAATMSVRFGAPIESRYQWMGAVLLLMVAAEVVRDIRVGRWPVVAVFGLGVAAAAANLNLLFDNANRYETVSNSERAVLAAVESAGPLDPELRLRQYDPFLLRVSAGPYLEAVQRHGSPAYSEADLPESQRPRFNGTLRALRRQQVGVQTVGHAGVQLERIAPDGNVSRVHRFCEYKAISGAQPKFRNMGSQLWKQACTACRRFASRQHGNRDPDWGRFLLDTPRRRVLKVVCRAEIFGTVVDVADNAIEGDIWHGVG
jgi:hypothetical protein